MQYDFENSLSPEKTFSLSVPPIDAGKYSALQFSIRAKEEGNPGIVIHGRHIKDGCCDTLLPGKRNNPAFYLVGKIQVDQYNFHFPVCIAAMQVLEVRQFLHAG